MAHHSTFNRVLVLLMFLLNLCVESFYSAYFTCIKTVQYNIKVSQSITIDFTP